MTDLKSSLGDKTEEEVISLKSTINKLSNQLDSKKDFEDKFTEILSEKNKLDDKCCSLEKTLSETVASWKEKVSLRDKEFNELNEKYSEVKKTVIDVEKVSSEHQDCSNKITELEKMYKSKLEDEAAISENYKLLSSTLEKIEEESLNKEAILKSQISDSSTQIESLELEKTHYIEVNRQLEDKADSLQSQVQRYKAEFDAISNEMAHMKSKSHNNSLIEQERNDHNIQLTELQNELDAMKSNLEIANNEWVEEQKKHEDIITKYKKESEEEKENVLKMESTIKKLNETKSWLQDKLCELEQDKDVLNKKLSEGSNETQVNEMKEQITQLHDLNKRLKEEIKSIKDVKSENEKIIGEKEETISSLHLKVESLDKKLSRKEIEIEKRDSEINKIKLKLTNLEQNNMVIVLEKEIAALKEARMEEQEITQNSLSQKDDLIAQKDLEISALMQDLKKSLVKSDENLSVDKSMKQETNKDLNSLQYELRVSEEARFSLASEITELRQKLDQAHEMKQQLQVSMANTTVNLHHGDSTMATSVDMFDSSNQNCSVAESVVTSTTRSGRKVIMANFSMHI